MYKRRWPPPGFRRGIRTGRDSPVQRHLGPLDDLVQSRLQLWAGLRDFVLDDRTVSIILSTLVVMTPSQLQLDCLLHPYNNLGRIPGQDGSWLRPLEALTSCDGRVVFESPPRFACLDVGVVIVRPVALCY